MPGQNEQPEYGRRHWVKFKVNRKFSSPYLLIWLSEVKNVWWGLMSQAPKGSYKIFENKNTNKLKIIKDKYHAFYTEPALITIPEDTSSSTGRYSPKNIVNGITRTVDNSKNMWASDPRQCFPQWIELNFAEPTEFNTVYLTFDTDLNESTHSEKLPEECVRDYQLSYYYNGKWEILTSVKNNFQRRRVHKFDTVKASKLKVSILATNGDKSARIYEIRVYNI
jgi:hypothetical protein